MPDRNPRRPSLLPADALDASSHWRVGARAPRPRPDIGRSQRRPAASTISRARAEPEPPKRPASVDERPLMLAGRPRHGGVGRSAAMPDRGGGRPPLVSVFTRGRPNGPTPAVPGVVAFRLEPRPDRATRHRSHPCKSTNRRSGEGRAVGTARSPASPRAHPAPGRTRRVESKVGKAGLTNPQGAW